MVLKRAIVMLMWLRSRFLPAVLCGLQQANFTVTGAKFFGLRFALCLCCYFIFILCVCLCVRLGVTTANEAP